MKRKMEWIFDKLGIISAIMIPITCVFVIISSEQNNEELVGYHIRLLIIFVIIYSLWFFYCMVNKRYYWSK